MERRVLKLVSFEGQHGPLNLQDLDGDGVLDEFRTPDGDFARPGLRGEPKRWLVICLDGVPLNVLESLWDRGHFREFYRPAEVISTLPSDSEAALTDILHTTPVPGYEQRYFDRARNAIGGGAWVTLTGRGIPYIRVLDYDPPGWAKALPYILPTRTYRADLGRLRTQFLASHQSVFLAHITASDSIVHLFPAAKIEPLLIEFENLVRELYLNARGDLGIMIFSDHGNSLTPSRGVPLEKFLLQHDWQLRGKIEGPRDIVVPSYGLIGFIAAYCQESAVESLARDLTSLEGADLVFFRQPKGEGATVMGADGSRADLRWDAAGSRYSYAAAPGDPLGLIPVFARLRATVRLAADGSASDADLFAETWTAYYPDPAARIREWALDHVRNPADVLVSLKPGYFHGAGIFQWIVHFESTHGALEAQSSLGFVMATRPLPTPTRLADLLPQEFLRKREAGGN
jgi:hypothetical protein